MITVPAHLYDNPSEVRAWEHAADGVIELESFTGKNIL